MLIRRLIYIVALFMCIGMISCVHEYPEEVASRQVALTISHDTVWTYADIVGKSFATRANDPQSSQRYVIAVYSAGDNSHPVKTYTMYRDDPMRSQFTTTIDAPTGDCELRVWSDNSTAEAPYYDVMDFTAITYAPGYIGGDREKDAFQGYCPVSIPAGIVDSVPVNANITLRRPLAAYVFISNDLSEFINMEMQRRSDDLESGGITNIDASYLSGCVAKVYYTGYLPSVYNHFSDKPVDAVTGVTYTCGIEMTAEGDAMICFDQLFISGSESGVSVAFEIFDPSGVLVSYVPTINVPVARGRYTIVRGAFLTSKSHGGVGVNPRFDGQYNIEIN